MDYPLVEVLYIFCQDSPFTNCILAVQTLGEEYTDIWEYSSDGGTPSRSLRAALIILPTLPSYVLARWGSHIGALSPRAGELLKALQVCLEVGTEINLAVFYLRGTYYDLVKRVLGIRHVGRISCF
jgi:peroxin-10